MEVGAHSLRAAVCVGGTAVPVPLGYSSSPYSCPSVAVRLEDGAFLFGDYARNWMFNNPRNFFHITDVEPGSELYAPLYQALASFVADEVIQCGWERPSSCMVVIPAWYGVADPRKTKIEAAVMASGIGEIGFVSDIAALCLRKASLDDGKPVLAFDLGYSGLTVSVIRRMEGTIEILSALRNEHIGGRAFDGVLFKRMPPSPDGHNDESRLARLLLADRLAECVEHIREELSYRDTCSQSVVTGVFAVSRKDFLDACAPLFAEALSSCKEALGQAGQSFADISQVLLCGGCSNMPYVQELISKYFAGNGNGTTRIVHLSNGLNYKHNQVLGAFVSNVSVFNLTF